MNNRHCGLINYIPSRKKKKKKKSKVRVPQDMVMGQCVQRVNEAAKRQRRASLETVPRVGVSALAFRGIQ